MSLIGIKRFSISHIVRLSTLSVGFCYLISQLISTCKVWNNYVLWTSQGVDIVWLLKFFKMIKKLRHRIKTSALVVRLERPSIIILCRHVRSLSHSIFKIQYLLMGAILLTITRVCFLNDIRCMKNLFIAISSRGLSTCTSWIKLIWFLVYLFWMWHINYMHYFK